MSLAMRRLRLASGLTLFVYVATHLINHALGLISLDTAESGLRLAMAVWQSAPGTAVLYGAFAVHIALALLSLYSHRTLRMPPLELLRIFLGLGIPTLLIGHAVSTRLAYSWFGHVPDYANVVWRLWHGGRQGWQLALLFPGWLHGCLGIDFAFSRRPAYLRVRPLLLVLAFLLPLCAAAAFIRMGDGLQALDTLAGLPAPSGLPDNDELRRLGEFSDRALCFYFALIGVTFLARGLRSWREVRRGKSVSITYPHKTVRVPVGWSVLEASRFNDVKHTSVCGGRGRCSTCRIRVLDGDKRCPVPEKLEQETLSEYSLDVGVRLACQLRPQGDIRIEWLMQAPPRSNEDQTRAIE